MSVLLAAGGAALFSAGAAIGAVVTLAAARRKIAAVTEAAEEANAMITAHSEHAFKDLSDAHARADAMISAIETAKMSTAKAEESVADLIQKITLSREKLERASRLSWFERSEAAEEARILKRAAKSEKTERAFIPPVEA
ncbi:MAG: hypothetical protein U5J99_11250 [Parvularculaceae bacterium]|nr:hypothetical protein [Parvularculaceae bacterium]